MSVKDTKITQIVPYNVTNTNNNDRYIIDVIPISKGCNYKKLCIMIFVTLFLVFLMITSAISIVGIVSIYHIMNELHPTPSPTITYYNISVDNTLYPTNIPTYTPSNIPTYLPSSVPSVFPSISPTSMPSNTPSNTPTFSPSVSPTATPSNIPTTIPSQVPSFLPSISPSATPSINPTCIPSISPIYHPDNTYTLYPTPLLINYINDSVTFAPTLVPTYIYDVIYVSNHTTTLYESNQFKILIEVFAIICPICLCCVCIHVPLAFVPLCLANKKDKMDRMDKDSKQYNGSVKHTIDIIQEVCRDTRRDTRRDTHKHKAKK